jgi:hypothetical protein
MSVAVSVIGDVKDILLPASDTYSLRFVGNDTGAMEITVSEVDLISYQTGYSKEYVDIELTDDKEFSMTIGRNSNVENARLFVTENGVEVAEIQTDGTETPITLNPPRPRASSSGRSVPTATITPVPSPQEQWTTASAFTNLVNEASRSGQNFVRTRHNSRYGVRATAWQTLSSKRYEHDTMAGNAVQVRVYIDNPSSMTGDVMVSAWVRGDNVTLTRNLFERFFNNSIQVVHFDHAGSLGQTVRAAARLDLTGMDAANLYFYAYDRATNTYRRIA